MSTPLTERLAERGGGVELLRVPAALFGAAARLRGALYDRGLLSVVQLDVPVLSVGNLTAGGTGKTPMVAWLARLLEARGLRPGLLARGYGRGEQALNDEGRLLARLFPEAPQVQDKDRALGGQELVRLGADVIVLDDGFQHRRLYRELDVVLIDAGRPWGLAAPVAGGEPVRALLPRGLLREKPGALVRADVVVITRADTVGPERCDALTEEILRHVPGLPVARARHRPSGLARLATGERVELGLLKGLDVELVSAIGNPEAFEDTVRGLGANVRTHHRFADHHPYNAADVAGLGDRALVTTAKDAVKLEVLDGKRWSEDAYVLEIEMELLSGQAVIEALVDALPPARHLVERAALHPGLHG
ncbi:MAG: tetraacyldisaccharide 4'-kinase [bacterium]|nr:tetraacyldisaccharide 4'-kinase [bacterium]